MKTSLIVAILFLTSSYIKAQESKSNPRETNPFGININLAGPTALVSGELDWFITPTWDVEAGIGLIGYFFGSRYYFNGNSQVKFTPYTGASVLFFESLFENKTYQGLYIPIGLQHWGAGDFTYSLEVAHLTVEDKNNLFGAFRIGWRLKNRKDN